VVCPLIEESEKLAVEAVTRQFEQLRSEVFPDLRVGLLHGRLRTQEKEEAMEAFRRGELQVLVATTVIEVGVDVPNATVMVILNAERFGLAQLHQLRGRVGRACHQAHCIVITDQKYDPNLGFFETEEEISLTRQRMRTITEENDGFVIAERDLQLRGPGEFYGTRQHGLPDLRLARLIEDAGLLEEARQAAFELVEQDPQLRASQHRVLRGRLRALQAKLLGMGA